MTLASPSQYASRMQGRNFSISHVGLSSKGGIALTGTPRSGRNETTTANAAPAIPGRERSLSGLASKFTSAPSALAEWDHGALVLVARCATPGRRHLALRIPAAHRHNREADRTGVRTGARDASLVIHHRNGQMTGQTRHWPRRLPSFPAKPGSEVSRGLRTTRPRDQAQA